MLTSPGLLTTRHCRSRRIPPLLVRRVPNQSVITNIPRFLCSRSSTAASKENTSLLGHLPTTYMTPVWRFPHRWCLRTLYSTNTSTSSEKNAQPTPITERCTFSFYAFVPLTSERAIELRKYLKLQLKDPLQILGRVYLSEEGINGQVSCPSTQTVQLRELLESIPEFQHITLNEAISHQTSFEKLVVTVRKQLVRDGVSIRDIDIHQQPEYLSPAEWHSELSSLPSNALLIDMRNNYESTIGHFQNAVRPEVTTFSEEIQVMKDLVQGKEEDPIYMYCTGGIRCSKAGAILKSAGFRDVKMLRGGITAYGRFIRKSGLPSLYIGKNFTFDQRLGEAITNDVLGTCYQCGTQSDQYVNCASDQCNTFFIQCTACAIKHHDTCGDQRCIDDVLTHTDPLEITSSPKQPTRWQHTDRKHPHIVRRRISENLERRTKDNPGLATCQIA
ncbi:hypothetical protein IWQ62_000673 [Dispira parvispora]|uniref:Rhodanese domain-containing protein n=1 Tax=Dispira parvispora TaxID=1520584 RepID=A0A9W8E8Z5_9FUNG|nr:hypothetical protein IWQ62_000673 [Dispira parvispora]